MLFGLDRVWDTPGWLRLALFVAAAVACANIPLALHRWVWRHRRLEQLARLLSRTHPRVGDQLLGIIELVRNEFEQARSPALCEAAIREVAQDAARRDFRDAVPNPRHRLWTWLAAVPLAVALGLFALFPAAAANAWQRFLAPWSERPALHLHGARGAARPHGRRRTASRSRSTCGSKAAPPGGPRRASLSSAASTR